MKYISRKEGELLFEQVKEVLTKKGLSPEERIPKYRSILEDTFYHLTKDVSTHLSDLFAKITYIFNEHNYPKLIEDNVHSLRKYANRVVHNRKINPKEIDEFRCLYQLSESIAYFSRLNIPNELEKIYTPHLKEIQKAEPSYKNNNLEKFDFRAVVEEVVFPKGEITDKLPVTLHCQTEDLGRIKLKLWNNTKGNDFGNDLRPFAKLVSPYNTIYVTEVIKYKDREDEYFASWESLLVVEPDYLIDVKDLANCRQRNGDNPLLFLLNRFNQGSITDRIMVGNVVGKMLDDLVVEQKFEYKKSFESVMRENSFGMLCLANNQGTYDNTKISQAYFEASDHEPKLRFALNQFQDHIFILEPTFISNKFGLQGRLDLLIQQKSDENRKHIIELKSSRKYPDLKYLMYPNHAAQTDGYDLLLSSTFPDRVGNNQILYSSAPIEEKPLRYLSRERFMDKQNLMMLRNQIVTNELKLSEGNFQPIMDCLKEPFGPIPSFQEDKLAVFIQTIKNLTGELRSYFFEFVQFIFRELRVAKVGANDDTHQTNGFAGTWLLKNKKSENSNVLAYLKIKEVSEDFHITLSYEINLLTQTPAFRVGDICILYPTPNPGKLDPLANQILKCTVIGLTENEITVRLVHRQLDKSYFKRKTLWALESDFRESSYKKMLINLFDFVTADQRKKDLILGKERPRFNPLPEIEQGEMNEVQMQEVAKALAAQDYYLIQGPPGTGKTSNVLCEIVKNRIREGQNVMVIAFTNRAVDEICDKLTEKNINSIRLGKSEKPNAWSVLSKSKKLDALYKNVQEAQVFVGTQSSFSNSLDLLEFKSFDTLVVDEASQLLEPQLVGLIPYFNRFILIGDDNQLPAVVMQSEESSQCRKGELINIGLINFRDSLFARLKRNADTNDWKDCYGILTIHYRMHQDVAEFPNSRFYQSKLKEGKKEQTLSIPAYPSLGNIGWDRIFHASRMVFIPSKRSRFTKRNEEEAILVTELLQKIKQLYLDNFDPKKTVGVITPFRAQIAMIRKHLPEEFRRVSVDTVERFQGSERDIIIISFAVKSDGQLFVIQSINEHGVDRKLNVALTRAKKQVILIGTEEYLTRSPVFKDLIEFIRDKNGYILNPLKLKAIPSDLF